ncbi:hypothetical protein LVJ94_28065 [Pendulispora rubella]|uniref:Tetratricopeptide repeat protein n=1 Tax=Pendulispora rubella TaxID=2741070 RepID=A0ABZ2KQ57_9BACT
MACIDYAAAMGQGRAATREKRYDDAIRAFQSAVRRRPFDASAWAEQGYAKLLGGYDAHPALAFAKTRTKKPALLSAIWFNDAEGYAREGKTELARVHYAVAANLGNQAAATKLGSQSRCTATWTTGIPSLGGHKGWVEVLQAMPATMCGEKREPKTTEKEARKEACRPCGSGAGASLEDGDNCAGAGPWHISNGYMHCSVFSAEIYPLGGNRFLVTEDNDFSGSRTSTGWKFNATSSAAEFIPQSEWPQDWPQDEKERAECPPGEAAPELEPDTASTSGCGGAGTPAVVAFEPSVQRYYDKSGKGRIEVTVWDGTPEVLITGNTATIRGGSCQEKVTLSSQ